MNLQGNINLLKLSRAGVTTIHGLRCVVIPVDENDIYISADQETLKAKGAYLNLNIYEARQVSEHGDTHYAKQGFSKTFREQNADLVEERKKVYFGNFKPNDFAPVQANAPVVEVDNNADLPF